MPKRYSLTRDLLQRHDLDLLHLVRFQLTSPGCIYPLVEVIDDMKLRQGYIFFVYQLLPVGPGHPHTFEAIVGRTPTFEDTREPFETIHQCKVTSVVLISVSMVYRRLVSTSFLLHRHLFFDRIHPNDMEGRPSPENLLVPLFLKQTLLALHNPSCTRYEIRKFKQQQSQLQQHALGEICRGIQVHLDDKDLYIIDYLKRDPNPETGMKVEEQGISEMCEEAYQTSSQTPLTDLLERLTLTQKDKKGFSKARHHRKHDRSPPASRRRLRRNSSSGSMSD